MKRVFVVISAALGIWLSGGIGVLAFKKPERPPLANIDKRASVPLKAGIVPAAQEAALARLLEKDAGTEVDFDNVLGTPKFIRAREGFLTGPGGAGRTVDFAVAQALPASDPHQPIKAFLNDHAALFGHGAEILAGARIKREFVTQHNGLRTVVWNQQLDGVDVFDAVLIGHVTKRGELVSISSHFVPAPAQAANAAMANRADTLAAPPISAAQAVVHAARSVGETVAPADLRSVEGVVPGPEKHQQFRAQALTGDTDVRLAWLPLSRGAVRLSWDVILTSRQRGELFRVVVDAETGEVIIRRCLTEYISDATYRVYTSDSPSPFSPGHPTPLTAQPPVVPRTLVVTNALNTNASPNGWIDDGDNETRGNNVDAHLDRDNDNQPDLPRPQGNPARVFDFPLDLTMDPTTYSDAAVVNLFYWNNWVHDKLYELGFTEAAGNFQNNNFGRGGVGNDAVQADAQDGGGFNNANFSTQPDGIPGRMQMYLFNQPNPDRDGDLDAEVMIHEYGHGLSNRRVGGGVGLSTLQSRGMGEGWSDFYSLALLGEPGDDINGNYAAGGYLALDLVPRIIMRASEDILMPRT
jgi:hypothetical protein